MPDYTIHFHFEDVQLNSFKETSTKAWIARSIEAEKKKGRRIKLHFLF